MREKNSTHMACASAQLVESREGIPYLPRNEYQMNATEDVGKVLTSSHSGRGLRD